MREAVQQATGGGTDAVGTVIGAVWGFVGGVFGLVTILILAFYLLRRRRAASCAPFVRLFPRSERAARRRCAAGASPTKVSAWLGGQLLLGGDHRHARRRSGCG